MAVHRETDYRKVKAVLDLPEVKDFLHCDGVPLIGDHAHYLQLGRGYLIYFVLGDTANMHGALLKGDTVAGRSKVYEQWQYLKELGVKRINTEHHNNHLRASAMCRYLRMEKTTGREGHNKYTKEL